MLCLYARDTAIRIYLRQAMLAHRSMHSTRGAAVRSLRCIGVWRAASLLPVKSMLFAASYAHRKLCAPHSHYARDLAAHIAVLGSMLSAANCGVNVPFALRQTRVSEASNAYVDAFLDAGRRRCTAYLQRCAKEFRVIAPRDNILTIPASTVLSGAQLDGAKARIAPALYAMPFAALHKAASTIIAIERMNMQISSESMPRGSLEELAGNADRLAATINRIYAGKLRPENDAMALRSAATHIGRLAMQSSMDMLDVLEEIVGTPEAHERSAARLIRSDLRS